MKIDTRLITSTKSTVLGIAIAALATVIGGASLAEDSSAIDPRWKPLTTGAIELGFNAEAVERFLAAGVELYCPGTVNHNGGVLNGWIMELEGRPLLVTNAHAFFDFEGTNLPKLPYEDCTLTSFADLAAYAHRGAKVTSVLLGSAPVHLVDDRADGNWLSNDRAIAVLDELPAGMSPLDAKLKATIFQGKEVFLVSRSTTRMQSSIEDFEPLIQACKVRKMLTGLPAGFLTDCVTEHGISAGLYVVRDPAGGFKPVGIVSALKAGNYIANGPGEPLALGIMLHETFFQFD